MTDWYKGDGSDGDLTISATRTEDTTNGVEGVTADATSGQKNITVANGATFAAGDWVLVIQLMGTGAGKYEQNQIDSVSGNVLTMKGNLANAYTQAGANDVAQVVKMKQYNSVTINSGGVWECSAFNGTKGGVLAAMIKGNLTVNTGGSLNIDGKGFLGGEGTNDASGSNPNRLSGQGDSPLGFGKAPKVDGAVSANGSGGGGSDNFSPGGVWGAGGGGGHATSGGWGQDIACGSSCQGNGGGTDGVATLENDMVMGGAGGGDYNSVQGGRGGAIALLIVGGDITISANVSSKGANGSGGTTNGGSGGGAGGSLRFVCSGTVALGTGNVVATGGTGGQTGSIKGGDGGTGRIATLSAATVTGSANPAINTASTDTVTGVNPFAAAIGKGKPFRASAYQQTGVLQL